MSKLESDDLDEATLVELFWALLDNADELCADAQVLMERGSTGRALSLAVLALEEYAKASNIAEADLHRRKHADRLRISAEIRRSWRSHRPKLSTAMLEALSSAPEMLAALAPLAGAPLDLARMSSDRLLDMITEVFVSLRDSVTIANVQKQRGFYVDVEDNTVLRPSDIQVEQAQAVLEAAGRLAMLLRCETTVGTTHDNPPRLVDGRAAPDCCP